MGREVKGSTGVDSKGRVGLCTSQGGGGKEQGAGLQGKVGVCGTRVRVEGWEPMP